MAAIAGQRGSSKRKAVVCGFVIVGLMVFMLAGSMAESSVKQVYWAVYARLHPMRDAAETYGYSVEEKPSWFKKQISGTKKETTDKHEVELQVKEQESIRGREQEKHAAKEAHQRESEAESKAESERVKDLAQQQLAKATANFQAEIEAVAGEKEADRLTDKLKDPAKGQTELEREAAEATKKLSAKAKLSPAD